MLCQCSSCMLMHIPSIISIYISGNYYTTRTFTSSTYWCKEGGTWVRWFWFVTNWTTQWSTYCLWNVSVASISAETLTWSNQSEQIVWQEETTFNRLAQLMLCASDEKVLLVSRWSLLWPNSRFLQTEFVYEYYYYYSNLYNRSETRA